MHAHEARKLTENANKVDMSEIYKRITSQADAGHASVSIDVKKWNNGVKVGIVKDELEKLGYKVKRSQGYDQRDRDSWDTLEISWA